MAPSRAPWGLRSIALAAFLLLLAGPGTAQGNSLTKTVVYGINWGQASTRLFLSELVAAQLRAPTPRLQPAAPLLTVCHVQLLR